MCPLLGGIYHSCITFGRQHPPPPPNSQDCVLYAGLTSSVLTFSTPLEQPSNPDIAPFWERSPWAVERQSLILTLSRGSWFPKRVSGLGLANTQNEPEPSAADVATPKLVGSQLKPWNNRFSAKRPIHNQLPVKGLWSSPHFAFFECRCSGGNPLGTTMIGARPTFE